ncbi:unnamed protein product [Linum trigynum]|uniref:Uncharacterized protein n=1 Tax=Linum trigynum TaxID=586398 RepID=A0AAV2CKF4_9ROSI
MVSNISEIISLRWLLGELGFPHHTSTPLRCDNQATLHIANNSVFHERTKHVKMDYYFFVRECVQDGHIPPINVSSELQLADLFTKGLGADRFCFLLSKLHVRDLHAPACGGVTDRGSRDDEEDVTLGPRP